MSSHRKLHYGLRPAKNIERKMICETLQRLANFESLHNYQYVGFGSRYFTDFTLIHKSLGIHNMISIEVEEENEEWFEFNKPYDCIMAIFEHSNTVLPDLDWDIPTILWLDYDGKLAAEVFPDITSFCSSAIAGSMLFITVNADARSYGCSKQRILKLTQDVGESRTPSGIKPSNLGNNGLPKVLRNIIDNEIDEILSIRNGVLPPEEQLNYRQLFNFVYKDGMQMLTVGGIFYKGEQQELIEKCSFSDFDYIKSGEDIYKIQVPNLTFREINFLNQHLPSAGGPPETCIPKDEIEQYAKIYRYFPTFTEAEV